MNSLIPPKQWIPPQVERKTHIPIHKVAKEFCKCEKSIAKVLGVSGKTGFLESFIKQWVQHLINVNFQIPVTNNEVCGIKDILEWIDEINYKQGAPQAEAALKSIFKTAMSEIGSNAEIKNSLLKFKNNCEISHIHRFHFPIVNNETKCVEILDPKHFSNPDNEIHYMRSLLATGSPFSYGTLIALVDSSHQSYTNSNIIYHKALLMLECALENRLDTLLELPEWKNLKENELEFLDVIKTFMSIDTDDDSKKAQLQNAVDITKAMLQRLCLQHLNNELIKENIAMITQNIDCELKELNCPDKTILMLPQWNIEAVLNPDDRVLSIIMQDDIINVKIDNELVYEATLEYFCDKNAFAESFKEVVGNSHNERQTMPM